MAGISMFQRDSLDTLEAEHQNMSGHLTKNKKAKGTLYKGHLSNNREMGEQKRKKENSPTYHWGKVRKKLQL